MSSIMSPPDNPCKKYACMIQKCLKGNLLVSLIYLMIRFIYRKLFQYDCDFRE